MSYQRMWGALVGFLWSSLVVLLEVTLDTRTLSTEAGPSGVEESRRLPPSICPAETCCAVLKMEAALDSFFVSYFCLCFKFHSQTFYGGNKVLSVARTVPGVPVEPDGSEGTKRSEDLWREPRQPILGQVQLNQHALGNEAVWMDGFDPVLIQPEVSEVCESGECGCIHDLDPIPREPGSTETGRVSEPVCVDLWQHVSL